MYRPRAAPVSLYAIALACLPPGVAVAQGVTGSGIPLVAAETPERPVEFAAAYPGGAALAVVMTSASLPGGLPIDAAEMARVERAISDAEFSGKSGSTLALRAIGDAPQILLVGVGEEPGEVDFAEAGGRVAQQLAAVKAPVAIAGLPTADAAADAALGYRLGGYTFDRYKVRDEDETPQVQPVTIVHSDPVTAGAVWSARQAGIAEGVHFARDLINEPASVIYPESFVERTRAAFRGIPNVEIEVLDEAAMRRLGMGAIVGVGQGSPRGSRMLLVTYRGADGPPLALVGKGITFDSGGLSIKSGSGMEDMKADMSGAAGVIGTALSLARTRAPVHVVAVAALAENMPSGNAQRPGDVVRTMGGKTIEIVNTDAEGRLVLADAVQYVAERRKPFAIVDLATLTGAAVSALGPQFAGLFAREDTVAERIEAAAKATGEAVWRLPLHPEYAKAVKSDIAYVKNSGASPAPGASSGAHFIEAFVADDMPWAHIDMAPTMWANSAKPLTPKGATGYGVRLLDRLARDWRPE